MAVDHYICNLESIIVLSFLKECISSMFKQSYILPSPIDPISRMVTQNIDVFTSKHSLLFIFIDIAAYGTHR